MYQKFHCIIKLYTADVKRQHDSLVYFWHILLNMMQK